MWVNVQCSRCDSSEDAMHHLVRVVEQKDWHPADEQHKHLLKTICAVAVPLLYTMGCTMHKGL